MEPTVRLLPLIVAVFAACAPSPTYRVAFPEPIEAKPGTVLIVLTSASRQTLADGSSRATGYFLNELYEPYQALVGAGYRVEFATPGGQPPAIDPESFNRKYWPSYATLVEARRLVPSLPQMAHPLALADVRARVDELQGIVVPGGQGTMVDLLDDPDLHALLVAFDSTDKPVGLVCHAPAILARMSARVRPGAVVTSVSRTEELFIETFVMGAKARVRRIGRTLDAAGYRHTTAFPGRAHAVRDCNLVTSQNPFSSDAFGRHYLAALRDFRRGGRCRAREVAAR